MSSDKNDIAFRNAVIDRLRNLEKSKKTKSKKKPLPKTGLRTFGSKPTLPTQ
jgi:hypothetical protein